MILRRRSEFITFILALFPGLGYIYLGLPLKGVEMMVLFLIIDPVFKIIGISSISFVAMLPLWFYAFFNTFTLADKIDSGVIVKDDGFLFRRKDNGEVYIENTEIGNKKWIIAGVILIILGFIALLNGLSDVNYVFNRIKYYSNMCVIPAIFIIAGIYMLYRTNKKN